MCGYEIVPLNSVGFDKKQSLLFNGTQIELLNRT